jgi:hypothetical protein
MRINFNRICHLAGIKDSSYSRRGYLNESKHDDREKSIEEIFGEGDEEDKDEGMMHYEGDDQDEGMMHYEGDEDEKDEGMMHYEGDEEDKDEAMMHEEDDANEMVEVDVAELMSEIRRAKKIITINENKKRRAARQKRIMQENHLKRIIQKEVENVLSEIEDRDNNWVYGKKQPTRSKRGYTAQGSYLPGYGFRRR